MKKLLIIFLLFQTPAYTQNLANAYFAGGCFWCMEESFEKTEGILEAISGYSGGSTENPTYKEVTYGNTGHFETVKITYDSEIISYKKVSDVYWKNIDPFDSAGQFCDKGYSYRSVVFYKSSEQKKIIEQGGILGVKAHIIKKIGDYVAFDGLDEQYRNYLDLLFKEIENKFGDSIWWTSMNEISQLLSQEEKSESS